MSSTAAQSRSTAGMSNHEARMWREVVTPEGATIRLRLADASERAGALFIDAAIMLLALIIGSFAILILGVGGGNSSWMNVAGAIWYLFFFVLRAFYFTIFEMGRRAATPGKRIMKLRVVAREGRQLTANAVFARNVMRELEVFLPFNVLMAGPGSDGLSAVMTICLVLWLGVFVLLPFFNKDKLRAGDIVAGTWVVKDPKLELGADISQKGKGQSNRFPFTEGQLATYGEHELQVLEEVLRGSTHEIREAVAERIRNRIGWDKAQDETDQEFLEAFYRALRQTLETRMLFGNRKKDKHDKS